MRQPRHRSISFAVSASASVAVCACTAVLDAPGSTFVEPPPLAFYLSADRPQPYSHFGDRVAVKGSAVAVTAPFETTSGDPVAPNGAPDGYVPDGEGATYLFDLTQRAAQALRVVAPNADPDDGKVTVDSPNLLVSLGFKDLPAMNVALNDDWLVVGAAGEDSALQPGDDPASAEADNSAPNAGAVYVYSRSRLADGDLTPFQYLKAPNLEKQDYFGASVALTDSELFVGAPGEDSGDSDDPADNSAAESGAVYVFALQERGFVFEQYLKPPAPITPNQLFGLSSSVDSDLFAIGAPLESSGTTAIGGERTDATTIGDGATYLYRRSDRGWQFEEYLKPATARSATGFGYTVRVSNDRVAVGAPGATNCQDEPLGVDNRGAVYTFDHDAGVWALDACLGPKPRRGDLFGVGVGLYRDTLLIGAAWDASGRAGDPSDGSQNFSGAAYLEQHTSGGWQRRLYIKAPELASDDVFGNAIDLGEKLAAVGASQRSRTETGEPGPVYAGAVYVFDVAHTAAAP
jgi:hypothetical protein